MPDIKSRNVQIRIYPDHEDMLETIKRHLHLTNRSEAMRHCIEVRYWMLIEGNAKCIKKERLGRKA